MVSFLHVSNLKLRAFSINYNGFDFAVKRDKIVLCIIYDH